jgi:hypothetical protein
MKNQTKNRDRACDMGDLQKPTRSMSTTAARKNLLLETLYNLRASTGVVGLEIIVEIPNENETVNCTRKAPTMPCLNKSFSPPQELHQEVQVTATTSMVRRMSRQLSDRLTSEL